MLNLKEILSNTDKYRKGLIDRGFEISQFDKLVKLSSGRGEIMTTLQSLEAEKNKISKLIGQAKSKGGNAEEEMSAVSELKNLIQQTKEKEVLLNSEVDRLLKYIPNIPHHSVPIGKDETDNVVLYEKGDIGRGKVKALKPHYEIGVELDIVDFDNSVRMSGARFWSYKREGAQLVRALQSYMLDTHTKNGYEEIIPPLMVNSATMMGTGQLPKFEDDLFAIKDRDLYLIPTAEVPLTNFYGNQILDLSSPKKLTGFTACFRAEAGSGGKDMKGLIRAHQFYKVEIVKITTKENSMKEFDDTLKDCVGILDALELPYQVLDLCTGDIGFSSEKTIDIEVWIPSEQRYRECSSVSIFGDYQARRAMLRYKDDSGKNQYATTINGSALAIDRVVASILEIYQNEDGTITVPTVLQKYMNNKKIIGKS